MWVGRVVVNCMKLGQSTDATSLWSCREIRRRNGRVHALYRPITLGWLSDLVQSQSGYTVRQICAQEANHSVPVWVNTAAAGLRIGNTARPHDNDLTLVSPTGPNRVLFSVPDKQLISHTTPLRLWTGHRMNLILPITT